jgi:Cys-tRNA(Pro)/Cys-tRNA(Cys) deacylase
MTKQGDRTNSMRMLDRLAIAYTAHHYAPERHSATEVASLLGFPAGQVFKTLVALPNGRRPRPLLAVIPGYRELDLKGLAAAADEKSVRMASLKEAEALTGLLVGGISPLALVSRRWRTYLDATARHYDVILVSAGQRGINLALGVDDLARVVSAQLVEITRPPAELPQG